MKSNTTLMFVAVALVLILGFMAFTVFGNSQGTIIGDNGGTSIVTSSTALTINGVDKFQKGTSVAGTSYISVDGTAYKTGITTASPRNKLSILVVNNSIGGYHNAYIESFDVPNSPTAVIPISHAGNASVTMKIYSTDNVVLTNDGGLNNQTVAIGGSYNLKLRMEGQDKKSTQPMRCILETTNAANTSDVILSGFGAKDSPKGRTSKPNWYTLAGTGSGVYVYDIDSIDGAVSPEGTIAVSSATSKSLVGAKVKVSCYTKEWFLDSYDGTVKFDVEDSLGNLQSMAKYAYTAQLYSA